MSVEYVIPEDVMFDLSRYFPELAKGISQYINGVIYLAKADAYESGYKKGFNDGKNNLEYDDDNEFNILAEENSPKHLNK